MAPASVFCLAFAAFASLLTAQVLLFTFISWPVVCAVLAAVVVVAAAAATNKLKLCMLRHWAMGICFVGKPLLSLVLLRIFVFFAFGQRLFGLNLNKYVSMGADNNFFAPKFMSVGADCFRPYVCLCQ